MIAWGFGIYGVGLLAAGWWIGRRFVRDRTIGAADVLPLTCCCALVWPVMVPWLLVEGRVARAVQRARGELLL